MYDTTRYQGQAGWFKVGGTSLSAPVIAGVYALGTPSVTYGSYPYSNTNYGTTMFDVVSGSNGSCSPAYLCTGGSGFDGPSGLGTPIGTGGF